MTIYKCGGKVCNATTDTPATDGWSRVCYAGKHDEIHETDYLFCPDHEHAGWGDRWWTERLTADDVELYEEQEA
jgi:hypothetical protein